MKSFSNAVFDHNYHSLFPRITLRSQLAKNCTSEGLQYPKVSFNSRHPIVKTTIAIFARIYTTVKHRGIRRAEILWRMRKSRRPS